MSIPGNPEETALRNPVACGNISHLMGRMSDKWTMLVVRVLGAGPRRFNALRREVGKISQKVLASTLRDLEENGLVSRTVTPVTPPQVEYALTPLGEEFLFPVRALAQWIFENSPRINDARAAYAASRSSESAPAAQA